MGSPAKDACAIFGQAAAPHPGALTSLTRSEAGRPDPVCPRCLTCHTGGATFAHDPGTGTPRVDAGSGPTLRSDPVPRPRCLAKNAGTVGRSAVHPPRGGTVVGNPVHAVAVGRVVASLDS